MYTLDKLLYLIHYRKQMETYPHLEILVICKHTTDYFTSEQRNGHGLPKKSKVS